VIVQERPAPQTAQEARKLWVDALRSGKYKQGKFALRRGDRFCCLGVACQLAVEAGVIPEPVQTSHDDEWVYGGKFTVLPKKVYQWLDIDETGEYETGNLVSDNDDGKTFRSIASIIEREWPT